MSKTDTKTKILEAGAEIIHEKGFNNTGINEVLKAAGVPKGSFYFYFQSKDDFGLALIDHYVLTLQSAYRKGGISGASSPDQRLFGVFDSLEQMMEQTGYRRGCPIGNLVQEMSDLSEAFREKLSGVFAQFENFLLACLEDGIRAGVFRKLSSPEETAGFILNSFEGTIMRAKLAKSGEPFRILRKNLEELLKEK